MTRCHHAGPAQPRAVGQKLNVQNGRAGGLSRTDCGRDGCDAAHVAASECGDPTESRDPKEQSDRLRADCAQKLLRQSCLHSRSIRVAIARGLLAIQTLTESFTRDIMLCPQRVPTTRMSTASQCHRDHHRLVTSHQNVMLGRARSSNQWRRCRSRLQRTRPQSTIQSSAQWFTVGTRRWQGDGSLANAAETATAWSQAHLRRRRRRSWRRRRRRRHVCHLL